MPAKAIEHGNADAELSENFKQLNASTDDFQGFPSSMIEGSYDLNGKRMHSYNRIVIATGSPPANQRYLIQFTVTGYADKAAGGGARHRGGHRRVQRRQEVVGAPRLGVTCHEWMDRRRPALLRRTHRHRHRRQQRPRRGHRA